MARKKPISPAPDLAHIAEPLRPLAVALDTLTLDQQNARTHGEQNLATITASLRRFGQRLPLVVQREGMVVRVGNGRVAAMRAMGWTHAAAVIVDESEVDATAFALVDNRSAELAEWDDATLARLLESLPQETRCDVGFSEGDMATLLDSLAPGAGGHRDGKEQARALPGQRFKVAHYPKMRRNRTARSILSVRPPIPSRGLGAS